MRSIRLFSLWLLLFAFIAMARAQSVKWQPADMPNAVQLVFDNCTPEADPQLPTIPGTTFTFVGRTESLQSSFNGGFTTTRILGLVYLVRSRQNGPIQIPAFTIKTDKGVMKVDAFNSAAAAAGPDPDSVASSRLIPERKSVWAGEVFNLTYELSASRRTNAQISPVFDWNAAPLVAEDWSKPELTEAVVNNERRLNVTFRTRAVMNTPNTLKLEAATHVLTVSGPTPFGGFGFFQGPQTQQVSVTSDQPTIQVRPLPSPQPAGFSGAVGQFKLTSKVVPEKAAVGEPVTWTLDLSGMGNWPNIAGLPSRDVSNDFRVVQPKARRTPAEGKLFDVTLSEDVVLVPTKAGSYTLGPINFSYFDPKAGAYKVVSAPRTVITITAPSTPQPVTPPSTAIAPGEPPPPAEKEFKPPTAPMPPAGIPRDPLIGTAQVRAPMSAGALTAWVLSPVACLLIFWGALALRQAKRSDPLRARREARARIEQTLTRLATATGPERIELLRAWQRDAAVMWQLSHAAPRASALPESAWQTLWLDAERALYGEKRALPMDWTARAQEAVAAKTVPGFKLWRAFLPQNLMPFAALLAVSFIGIAWLHAAEAGGDTAYRKGDFAAAEKAWRARIAAAPTDWIARHNLSLALAQQERAGEAAAHAAAAYVQQPSNEAVRWQFAFAAEKVGTMAQPLGHFITPGPLQSLARLASPAGWQWLIIACAWAAAIAGGCLLVNAFGRGERGVMLAALLAVVLCVGLAASAVAGIHAYGWAARADAVMIARGGTLRSIPTEADTTQKTSPLSVGALAIADKKTFLDWRRLTFENGQTGWVRKDDIVALWK